VRRKLDTRRAIINVRGMIEASTARSGAVVVVFGREQYRRHGK